MLVAKRRRDMGIFTIRSVHQLFIGDIDIYWVLQKNEIFCFLNDQVKQIS